MHVIAKAIRSIVATVLENALSSIYVVLSFSATRKKKNRNNYYLITPEPAPIPIYINYGSKFVVLGYNSTYFSNKVQKGKTCYSEEQVISMLEFRIDNIFVSFGGTLFLQVVGILMGTN